MNRISARRALGCLIPLLCAVAALSRAAGPPAGAKTTPADAQSPPSAATAPAAANAVAPPPAAPSPEVPPPGASTTEMPKITGLFDESAASPATGNVGLNHKLWVGLEPAPSATPDRYVLFFNGNEVKGLDPATDATYTISHGKTAPDT